MRRFFVSPGQAADETVTITGSDVNHIKNVLRMSPGDELLVSAGELGTMRCAVETLTRDEVTARIVERGLPTTEPDRPIVLYQGLPKGDKMEWIIQKSVELGVTRIVPVAMKNCVVRLTQERAEGKLRRWNAVAESAAKQCGRDAVPAVDAPLPFARALEDAAALTHRLMAYENARGMAATREAFAACREQGGGIAVLIGPEGGFDPAEAEAAKASGFAFVGLGRRILRAETAPLAALAMINYVLEP